MTNTNTTCEAVHHGAASPTTPASSGRNAKAGGCSRVSPRHICRGNPWVASVKSTSAFAHAAVEHEDLFSSFQASLNSSLRSNVDPFFNKFDVVAAPFVVSTEAFEGLRRISRVIFGVVEKVIHMYIEGEESLGNHFAVYERLRPFMTKRSATWQQYGRYDFLISDVGSPVFCELNTAMASAYLPMHYLNKIFHREAPSVLTPREDRRMLLPYDHETPLGRPYRRMEILANATHGAVAILVDENQKYHEADLIKADLEAAGRDVIIGSTKDIRRVGGNVFLNNSRISSTYNKFRLFGAQHRWSEQAFIEYWPFLETVRRSDIHLVNNFAAMTISEDKSIFGAMRLPAVQEVLSEEEKQAVERHTPRTYLLTPGKIVTEDGAVDTLSMVKAMQDNIILKPRSDYRGTGVLSGRDMDRTEFENKVDELSRTGNYVAQQRIESVKIDVPVLTPGARASVQPMNLSGGIYFADSDFQGIAARVAPREIINAATKALVLPVSCTR
jgi:hypothetical protein